MACGGFVISNWQPEIAECFEEGKEIVTFRSLEECMEKIAYYLEHEEERKQIAAAGFRKVKERFALTGLQAFLSPYA
jgi:spore maturation protein CgeB